jgi:hypothetical protein
MREKLDALGSSAGEIGERDGRETRHKRERETGAERLRPSNYEEREPLRSHRCPSKQLWDRVVSAPLQPLSKQTHGRRGDGNKGVQI